MQKEIPQTVPGDAYKQLEEEVFYQFLVLLECICSTILMYCFVFSLQHHRTAEQLQAVLAEREVLAQRCHELQQEVSFML